MPLLLGLLLAGCGMSSGLGASKHPHHAHPGPHPQATTLASAVAVSIDNAPGAWPQSGLSHADLVFEFPAEGGITRYLAVFWHQAAAKIGPVRSTRIYFDHVAAAYGWPLAHAGGNVDALNALGPLGIKNLDEIYNAGPYFWRSSDRQMPHNLYTSTSLLEQGITQKGYAPAGIPRLPIGQASGQKTESVLIHYADYGPAWIYDVGWNYAGGVYQRQIDGKNVSTQAGNLVQAANVVVVTVPEFSDPDPYTTGAVNFALQGGGQGVLLQGGRRQAMDWTFGNHGFTYRLPDGKLAPFARGRTWVEVVPTGTSIVFTPQH